MDPQTIFELAEMHLDELRVEAARARLVADASRARPDRSLVDRLRHVASRWQRSTTASISPATEAPSELRASRAAPLRTSGPVARNGLEAG